MFLGLFILASFLMIWRLENLSSNGLGGTVLGTLVMPYCSGISNLTVAYVMGQKGGSATEVMTNCLVNNVTNMTLILGVPAIFWSMNVMPAQKANRKKGGKAKPGADSHQVNRLSLLLTLTAVLFFTGATWALGSDGKINFTDGLVLVGLFLFWQCFHVFDVLKSNAQQSKGFGWMLVVDLALLAFGTYLVYLSTDWLVQWVSKSHTGFLSRDHVGWLSGWLGVLPNAMLAVYYAVTKRPEVVYTSQVGDGHICIPLCIGIFAIFRTIEVPSFFTLGLIILLGATLIHFFFIAVFGRLPSYMGWILTAAYAYFLYRGLGAPG
ncbi:MAG: sodium:calcium symporter [Pedosphaera sp.]|nr:sodium:calcium symporter [Pedosphaera sp.]